MKLTEDILGGFRLLVLFFLPVRLATFLYFWFRPGSVPLGYGWVGLAYDLVTSMLLAIMVVAPVAGLAGWWRRRGRTGRFSRLGPRVVLAVTVFLISFLGLANLSFFHVYQTQLKLYHLAQWKDLLYMPSLWKVASIYAPLALLFWLGLFWLALRWLRWSWRPPRPGLTLLALVLLLLVTQGVANGRRYYGYKKHPLQSNGVMLLLREGLHSLTRRPKLPEPARLKRLLKGERDWDRGADFLKLKRVVTPPEHRLVEVPLSMDPGARPHIVLFTLESYMAFESGFYGPPGRESKMPFLDSLFRDSLTVRRLQANAHQTVRGDLAIQCSHLPNFQRAMLYYSHPFNHLDCLPEVAGRRGYRRFWLSGFLKDFHNKRVFLTAHGMPPENLYDKSTFGPGTPQTGDGISDFALLGKLLDLMDEKTAGDDPVLASIITYSTHYPFVLPADFKPGRRDPHPFQRTLRYTDLALKTFFTRARERPWFQNTVFVLVGDHTMMWPYWKQLESGVMGPEYVNQVVFAIYAPGRIKPVRLPVAGSQIDILPTLADLLGWEEPLTAFGSSLLDRRNRDRLIPFFNGAFPGLEEGGRLWFHYQDQDLWNLPQSPGINGQPADWRPQRDFADFDQLTKWTVRHNPLAEKSSVE